MFNAVAISALAFWELPLQTDLLGLIVKSFALGISPLLSPRTPPVAGVGGLAIESAAKGNPQFLE